MSGQAKQFGNGTCKCILLALTFLIPIDSEVFGNENGVRLTIASKESPDSFLAMVKNQMDDHRVKKIGENASNEEQGKHFSSCHFGSDIYKLRSMGQ